MHYQSLNAALEQYSGSLTQNPASPDSLALHIDRQTQGRLKLYTPDTARKPPPNTKPQKPPPCRNTKKSPDKPTTIPKP